MKSIFIQISSLNDDEFYKTIKDCIEKSSGTTELFFGLHECYIDNKTEFDFDNVKIAYSKCPENLGIGKGRYIANKFYNGENYYLQIDAHSRFAKDWDISLINDLENYISNGIDAILTTYPMRYWYENGEEILESGNNINNIIVIKDQNILTETRNLKQEAGGTIEIKCAESTSGGFVFGPGRIASVEHHPGIFFGEELFRAAAFYTNGYCLMIPEKNVIYHLYGADSNRKAPWEVAEKEFEEGLKFSKHVIKSIFSDNRINNISLGDKRPLKEYGNYLGVDFEKGILL
jgi:hypothetical protein